MFDGGFEFAKIPEFRNPAPLHFVDATTLKCTALPPPPPPPPDDCGSPGLFAGASAFALRWTVPFGATVRMSSSVLFELNVTVWTPMKHHVTDPPTGMWIFAGPNSVTAASPAAWEPEPASAGCAPGSLTGIGALPCRSAVAAGCSFASAAWSVFWPAANCALGLGTDVEDGTTTTL